MTDRLMKLYELNERYHDTKEKRAWLATTFYAGFSLVVIRLATNKEIMVFLQVQQAHRLYQILILIFILGLILGFILFLLSVIFVCVLFFIRFQYIKKRASVDIEGHLTEELSVQNQDESIQLARVFRYMRIANEKKSRCKQRRKFSSTEIPIFGLMIALFVAQILGILIAFGTSLLQWFMG
jgi:hypothetical protein